MNQTRSINALQVTKPRIRVIALALIQNKTRILVEYGYDPLKQEGFYRALGGGVEFGETSREALQREFQEEIQAELTQIQYLGCIENLFVFNGKPGHELIQLYQCQLADPHLYEVESITGQENGAPHVAYWIEVERFKSGELRLVPEGCLDYV
jgi:8-oxo-dGTP pyrophosphatase MutT (NUDIX family)